MSDDRYPHMYRHLDKNDKFKVEVPLRELVEQVEEMNYGTQRLLSHLVDVRREKHAERVKEFRSRGDHDVAASVERGGDVLADEIERLLKMGLF